MNSTKLPSVFCWTKMGTEAGQPLDAIIARKEAERKLGGGIFFWGIGTPLGQKIWGFVDSNTQPFVLFSPMKARPKHFDCSPEEVLLWTSYIDREGIKHAMPNHVLVTSRGNDKRIAKGQHYALVCRKATPLGYDSWPSIDWAKLRNYKDDSKLGFSQVTAIVEFEDCEGSIGGSYDVLFGAELVSPYYVTLADPVPLPQEALLKANEFWTRNTCSTLEWYERFRSEIIGSQ
jgi:hypothetical protein